MLKVERSFLQFAFLSDRKAWIVSSPSGYFSCSENADGLFGWVIPAGYGQLAHFISNTRFISRFYRPDIIFNTLRLRSESKAIELANRGHHAVARGRLEDFRPPVITLLELKRDLNGKALIKFQSYDPPGFPLTQIIVKIHDGVELFRASVAAYKAGDTVHTIEVPLGSSDGLIEVYGVNKVGSSDPSSEDILSNHLKRNASSLTSMEKKPQGDLWVLSIGVREYSDPQLNSLKYPEDDARAFAQAMQPEQKEFYKGGDSLCLTSKVDTTKEAIVNRGIPWIKSRAKSGDTVMLFFAGHGIDEDSFFSFLPSNYSRNLEDSKLEGSRIRDLAELLISRGVRVVIFLDACHSALEIKYTDFVLRMKAGLAVTPTIFAACEDNGLAYEDLRYGGHGAFTYGILRALKGIGSSGSLLSSDDLSYSVHEIVKQLTANENPPQLPVAHDTTESPLIKVIKS